MSGAIAMTAFGAFSAGMITGAFMFSPRLLTATRRTTEAPAPAVPPTMTALPAPQQVVYVVPSASALPALPAVAGYAWAPGLPVADEEGVPAIAAPPAVEAPKRGRWRR